MKIGRRRFPHLSVKYVVLLLLLFDLLLSNNRQVDPYNQYYLEGNDLYEQGAYADALEKYEKAIEENEALAARNPNIRFKIAYCKFKTGRYAEALSGFRPEGNDLDMIADYNHYFALNTALALGDTALVIRELGLFPKKFPNTPLVGKIDSVLADLYLAKRQYTSAKRKFAQLSRYRAFDKSDINAKLLTIYRAERDRGNIESQAFKMIRSYPFHPESKSAYNTISGYYEKKRLGASNLNHVFNYLTKTEQFDIAATLLDNQERLGAAKQQIRWLRIRSLYLEERYWDCFQACKSQRKSFKYKTYLRHIDLHLARCYMALGFVDKAIEAYDVFVTRYPSDYLAAEVLWVMAWLCEDEGEFDQAIAYYQRLIKTYPRYEFVTEAKFRIGLARYRENGFAKARGEWEAVLGGRRRLDDMWRSRLNYWIAKSYSAENNFATYLKRLDDLSKEPFDSYYNLKALLLTRKGNQVHTMVDSLMWEAQHNQVSYLPKYLDVLQRPLLVQEVLGDDYARNEMNYLVQGLKNPEWELLFALAEANEQLNNYGKAFRLYGQVYSKRFSNRDLAEWVFLFKRLYPLYFNGDVNKYAQKWKLDPASVWAVIKKESAFEPQIISYANAYGLMQIIPPTARGLTEALGLGLEDVRKLYEPKFNIHLGTYYLSELMKRYEGNLYYALAAYNAGEHRVDVWSKVINTEDDDFFMENIRFEQTRKYVRGVMKFYWVYQLLINPNELPDYLVSFPEQIVRNPDVFEAVIYE